MNPLDDQAPPRHFESIRHLTNRSLNVVECGEWCQKLTAWTNGFSSWVYARQKAPTTEPTPQVAWKRRQQQRNTNPQPNPLGNSTPQPNARNRAIRRKANRQKFYSNPGSGESGYNMANSCIKLLAYADDLCILATSRSTTQEMLDRAHLASRWAGLTFNARKGASLTIQRSQGSRQRVVHFEPTLGHEVVPALSWAQSYKYLGCRVGADPKVVLSQIGKDRV